MDGILKVTPEKLLGSSDEFGTQASQMHSLTEEMMSLVNSLNGIWIGEANSAYSAKFNTLQSDMDKLYRMVMEHSKDLSEMAGSYARAESENVEAGTSLNSGVIV